MKNDNKSEKKNLRQQAEERLKNGQAGSGLPRTEVETLKLIHELEVHQLELEMQSEELRRTKIIAQETADKYMQLYDFAPTGYCTLSQNGEIVDLNHSAATMLGGERPALKNKVFSHFIFNETRTTFDRFFDRVMSSNHNETCEVNISENPGQYFYVQLTGIASKDKSYLLLNMMDITERRQSQAKLKENEAVLEKLNIDKDLFISILAHDLKNPFNIILGYLSLLSINIRRFDIDKIESQVNMINESAQKVHNLLDSILMWASSQAGKLPYEPKELNLKSISYEMIEMLKQSAEAKSITINYRAPENFIVFADANMLKTVLRNLITNAIKFTGNGGSINIAAEQSDEGVTITVSDTGVGLEPGMMDKLFNVSQMQTTKGTESESGSGLGLLYCKNFIEKHGGTIWVESEKGKGSSFKFTLPNKQ